MQLRKILILAAAVAGLALTSAQAQEAGKPTVRTSPSLAKIEQLFPSCAGMFSQADVDSLTQSAGDPLERFEAWRRQRLSMIEASPVVVCKSKVWRSIHHTVHKRAEGSGIEATLQEETDLDAQEGSLDKSGSASANTPLAGGVNEYQGEVQVSVNPNNASQMVAGANTFFRDTAAACQAPAGSTKTYGTQALYGSTDGGKTWVHRCAPWPAALTGGVSGADAYFGSDPAMAWDNSGNAYAAYMLLSTNSSTNAVGSAIVVARSSDSGATWTPLGTVVDHITSTTTFDDKEMLAIDNSSIGAFSHPGRLYVIWDTNNVERAAFSDDGVTWTPHVFTGTGTSVGADIKVGPDGTVYAVWNRVYSPNNLGQAQADDTYFSKSTDGGVTWTAPVKIFTHSLASFQSYYRPAAQDERGVNSFPALDIDRNPSSSFFNRLYLAYADVTTTCCPLNTFGQIDAYARFSSDGGTAWSSRAKVNDDTAGTTHIFPWLGVDQSDGTVNIAWYDTRNDVSQERTQIFYARSVNGGATFQANINLSDGGTNFNNLVSYSNEYSFTNIKANPNQYGDYMGLAATNRKVTAVWADTRQFFPAMTTSARKEDIAAVTFTNCSAPRLSVPSATVTISGVNVSWAVQTWGVNATGGSYTLTRYSNSLCQGIGVSVGTYGSGTTSALDTPPASGTYYYGVIAKNNCPGTSLTAMKSASCSAAVIY